jgi:hypothetical protein
MQKINIQELTAVFISNKTRKSEIQNMYLNSALR